MTDKKPSFFQTPYKKMWFGPGSAPVTPGKQLKTVIDRDAGCNSQGVVGQRNGQAQSAAGKSFC
jgi:hypothetical protein